jgi:drug/metabolite transporter (DMT)-like permease
MSVGTAIAFGLALLSTTLTSLAYLREHEAAVALPALSLRRPLQSLRLLLTDHGWMLGFVMETGGFLLYAAALALAPLALVQSIAAGGIGLLAFLSVRLAGGRLGRRRLIGVVVAVLGLVALAISLAHGSGGEGHSGSTLAVLLWIGGTAVLAGAVIVIGRSTLGVAVANALAGGLFFSIGDISTKLATQGGARIAFVVPLILGYTLGTTLLQLGYQAGAALTVAGLATLLTNVLPILAGTIVLEEPVPSGALGALRVLAFVAVTVGAVLLARPGEQAVKTSALPVKA